ADNMHPTASAASFTGLANGTYYFRVRAMFPGQIGFYVTAPSNVVSVVVDQRSKVDITSQVSWPFVGLSYNPTTKVEEIDYTLMNNSTQTYLPNVDMNIISISSGSGTVRVNNADNGGNGTSLANAALFRFNQQLGPDQQFIPSQQTSARPALFQDN